MSLELTHSRALSHEEVMDVAHDLWMPFPLFNGAIFFYAIISDFSESALLDKITVRQLLSFLTSRGPLFEIRDSRFTSFIGLLTEAVREHPTPTEQSVAALRFPKTMALIKQLRNDDGITTAGCLIDAVGALLKKPSEFTITLRRYNI